MCTNFINIYTPCNSVHRREVWRSLLSKGNVSIGEEWYMRGDFNIFLSKEERIGNNLGVDGRDMAYFNNFLEEMKLVVLPCVGGRFTWFSGNRLAMNRMDRIMLTKKIVSQFAGKRVMCYHCPVGCVIER